MSIFTHYKQGFRTIMEINFFDYVNNRVFFNLGKGKLLYLIAFFSKILNFTEYNYKIYNKELLAIIKCFEIKLKVINDLIKVIINYRSLKYFMTTKKLLKKQIY